MIRRSQFAFLLFVIVIGLGSDPVEAQETAVEPSAAATEQPPATEAEPASEAPVPSATEAEPASEAPAPSATEAEPASEAPDPTAVDAEALFDAEDYAGAAAAYEALVATDPENGESWFGLGRARHFQDDWSAALEAYDRALELGFNPARVQFHAARSAAASGDREATVDWLRQIANSGQKPYLAVVNAAEFDPFRAAPEFLEVVARLRPCGGEEYRQFDFWVGEWEVTNLSRPGDAAPPAINRIRSLHDGCTLREDYQAPSGFTGTSLSFYDASTRLWNQTWIDNQGQVLHLSGMLIDGAMVMADPPDTQPLNRITWSPLDEGRVRQLWEVSTDAGENWSVVFDGLYSPAASRPGDN